MKQIKPNKRRLRKWVEALRSRKYRQIDGTLNAGKNLRCCLGVACDVYMQSNPKLKLEWKETGECFQFLGRESVLPHDVRVWFGLEASNPTIGKDDVGLAVDATTANDELGWKFGKIAKSIEKHYKL